MEAYMIFKDLAILILSAKVIGLLMQKIKIPQVVGEILAGLLVGPCLFNWVQPTDFLAEMSEIGVVLLMFSTGLGTNLKQLIKVGPVALLIACFGVFIPLVSGTFLYGAFYGMDAVGTESFYKAVFIGVILTATSVSITANVLMEMNKVSTKVGTALIGAAVMDDVIGVIVLTGVLGISTGKGSIGNVLVKTVLFLIFAVVAGILIYKAANVYFNKHGRSHRESIFSLALCFGMAFVAEHFFGIADITGAYLAGLILCSLKDAEYIESKMNVGDYLFFSPIFFASIGLKTSFDGLDKSFLQFCICFVAVALIAKVAGCGLAAKIGGFDWGDSLKIGVGMMTRGEVALVVASKGLPAGLVDPIIFTAVIILILCSSILTPVLLKILYSKEPLASAD
ncbi:cation:proton antiporter [Lachnospiraceae bacterium 45-W7]